MLRSLTRRRMAPVVVAAAVALVLTGCGGDDKKDSDAKDDASSSPSASSTDGSTSGAGDEDADPCTVAKDGLAADVKVEGAFGKKDPKVTFDKGLEADQLERHLAITGTKAQTKKGDSLQVVLTAYLARTGEKLSSEDAKLTVADVTLPLALDAGFDCVPVGSRVITTFPASDLYGDAGNAELGIEKDDSMIVVTDIVEKVEPLKPASWPDAPKVTFKGKNPSFKLTGKPSTELQMKVLKKGNGAVVGAGDTVTVDYYGVSWNTKKVFDESYSKAPAEFGVTGVVQGFGAALVGQKVGSRVIVTMPPALGYGEGKINANDLVGQTLVFVVDIRSTKAP